MAAPALNLDLSSIAIGSPRVPDPIANALSIIQTTINSLGNAHIASDAMIAISKTLLGTYTQPATWNPTLTGWSGTPTSLARYMQIGKLVFCELIVTGTSNSVNTQFTLPVAPSSNGALNAGRLIVRLQDNGVAQAGPGLIDWPQGSSTVSVYKDGAGTTWTASGTKYINVAFLYEAAS